MAEYLSAQKSSASGENVALWEELESSFKKKLWHQLTVFLETNIHHPMFAPGGLLLLYNNFISKFEDRINPLSLVKLLVEVAQQQPTPQAAVEFLSKFSEKSKKSDIAHVLLLASIANCHVISGDLPAAKVQIDAAAPLVEALEGVTPVHQAYYRVAATYYKHKGDFAAYYAEALRFLGCLDLASLAAPEQAAWACDVILAALVGERIYNFGEVLSHPILSSLKGTDKEWLPRLLSAFNSGDHTAVENLGSTWRGVEPLASNLPVLAEKLRLLSLMELVYRAPAHHRALPFASIAEACRVAPNEVELLVMRALARGLVKGSLDGVGQVAHLHWVQPRVLDIAQLSQMHVNLHAWIGTVKAAADDVTARGAELLVE